jgi:hypothetical protein
MGHHLPTFDASAMSAIASRSKVFADAEVYLLPSSTSGDGGNSRRLTAVNR